jgi:hypothetical protein
VHREGPPCDYLKDDQDIGEEDGCVEVIPSDRLEGALCNILKSGLWVESECLDEILMKRYLA